MYIEGSFVIFLNIVDTSETAREIYSRGYQKILCMSAVPLNYIIDKDGKIVEGWYGYQEDEERGLRVLEKLGIK